MQSTGSRFATSCPSSFGFSMTAAQDGTLDASVLMLPATTRTVQSMNENNSGTDSRDRVEVKSRNGSMRRSKDEKEDLHMPGSSSVPG